MPSVNAIAASVAIRPVPSTPGRQPAERRAPSAAPTTTPEAIPLSAPSPETRFSRDSWSPGIRTEAFSASFSTVSSGVLELDRPRAAMSRYVAAFSPVVPAAPAIAPFKMPSASLAA